MMRKNWPVVLTGSLLFLVIVILTLDSHFRSERALLERYSETQALLAQEVASRLEAHLNHYAQTLLILKTTQGFHRASPAKRRTLLRQFLEWMHDPRIESFSFYNPSGRIVASTRPRAMGRSYPQCDFFLWAKETPQPNHVFITTLVPPPEMQAAEAANDSVESEHAHFHVLMATPVFDSEGNFSGVLTLILSLEDLLQGELSGMELSNLGIWIIATDGTLIYQSQHPEMELENIYNRDTTCLECHVSFDYVETVLKNPKGTVAYQLQDEPRKMAAFASISLENIDWRVVVNVPMATISAIAAQNLRRVMASIFFTAFLFLLGAYLMYRNYRLKVRMEEEARQAQEKQRLLEQLQDSEELYRTIVDTAHDMIWILDPQGHFTFINRRAEEVTGFPVKEWIGKSFEPLIHPEDLPKVQKIFQETLQGKSQAYEVRVVAPDGRLFHFSVHTAPLYREGQIVGTISFGRDVTKEKEAERALLRREAILEAMRYGAETFLRVPDVDRSIPEFLKHLGQAAEVERLCIYENFRTPEGRPCARQRYQWLCEEFKPSGEHPLLSTICYEGEEFKAWTQTLEKGRPLLLSIEDCPPTLRSALEDAHLHWLLVFPIFVDQAWWGFLSFGRHRTEPWSTVERDALQTAADMIGSALERWELEQEAASLAQVLTHLNTARTIHDAFPMVASAVRGMCACTHVLLVEHLGQGTLRVLDMETQEELELCSEALTQESLQQALGEPTEPGFWLFEDLGAKETPKVLRCLFPKDVRSGVLFRLQAGSEWLGMLILGWPYPEGFHLPKVRRLTQLTQALSMAWQRSRLMTRAEEEARRLHRIITSVRAGILVLDRDRRIVLANPLAEDYLQVLAPQAETGKPLESLAGVSLDVLLKPPPFGVPYHEITLRKPRRRIFQITAYSLKGEEWVLLIRDVTKEREIQERARQQDRLAAVGQLAAGIAHDFNNILTTVIGIGELLALREDLPPEVQKDLRMIVEQGERAARLIRQVLDFSRKSVTEKQPLDLLTFLKESVRWLQRTFPETIRIELDWEPGNYWLYGDPAQLQQVLTNLALNSRDAMPEGGEIRIHLSRVDLAEGETPPHPEVPPGKWIVITFSDTGTGIPPEILPRIFEPFFTTKKSGVGTGLGLAQVHGIVKQHDGYIFVESEVGKGTTFTIYFPALLTKADIEKIEQKTPLPKGQGEWILVVEDDPAVRYLSKSMLSHLGYHVLLAKHGKEALELFEEHRDQIRLVITDLLMPEMDGRALIQALKERAPEIPVVIMTGYPRDPQALELLTKGEIPWIQKPLQLPLLARVVHEALNVSGQSTEAK